MSVLMKALEKAAHDRDKAVPTAAPAEPGTARRELTLEALESLDASSSVSRVALGNPPRAVTAAAPDYATSRAKPAAGTEQPRSTAQVQAATVLAARQPARAGAIEWLRARPLYALGGLAGLFLLAYGAYVYVQIAHPGLLLKTPPALVGTTPPPRSAPVPSAAPRVGEAANSQLVPPQSVFAGRTDVPTVLPAVESTPGIASGAPERSPPPPALTLPLTPRSASAIAAAPASAPTAAQNRIAVSRGDSAIARVNPVVSEAYAALEAGNFDTAQRLYTQVLRSEPANVDALLGLAAIAQKDNRLEDAQRYFLAILDVEPRHALAQSGLVALMSRADPQAAESRLKQLLAREPSPPLYFNLGNLYADQGQWPQAQQAYFQAHTLEPRNPDYAYNLAVGLEHLGQQKLALGFYRKAQQLAAAKGAANFEPARIQDRITQLSTQFD